MSVLDIKAKICGFVKNVRKTGEKSTYWKKISAKHVSEKALYLENNNSQNSIVSQLQWCTPIIPGT